MVRYYEQIYHGKHASTPAVTLPGHIAGNARLQPVSHTCCSWCNNVHSIFYVIPFRRSSFLSIFLFWIPFKEKTRGFICTLSVETPASKRLQYLESTSDTTLSIGSSTAVGCALVLAFSPLVFPSLVHSRISTAQSYRSPASPSRHVATDGPLKLRHHVCHLLHLAVLRSWRTQG